MGIKKHNKKKHILVTGCPRSGTTFLGTVLSFAPTVGYVREPFNFDFGLEGLDSQFLHLYEGMPEQEKYDQIIDDLIGGKAKFRKLSIKHAETLQRKVGRVFFGSGSNFTYVKSMLDPRVSRLLLKDPMASFASEYFMQKKDFNVVAIVRHPIPTISSMTRVGVIHNLEDLKKQGKLYRQYLKSILDNVMLSRLSDLEQRALLWLCVNRVLSDYAAHNPGFIVVRHEDLSIDPVKNFPNLYKKLGLKWTAGVEDKLTDMTSAGNPSHIKTAKMHVLNRDSAKLASSEYGNLSKKDHKVIQEITGDLTEQIYQTTDWPLQLSGTGKDILASSVA